ncbi:SLC13 family permease [Paracoccus cavernae]
MTIIGLALVAVLVLAFKLDIGFVSLSVGLVIALSQPNLQKRAMSQVAWPEIMLITGVGTYIAVLEGMGTIDFIGNSVASMASPMLAALLLFYIGGIVSAFASSTALLGALIPLAVPFLQAGTGVSPIGFIAGMAVASTIVDVSPFSTSGALVLANSRGDKAAFYRQLMGYGALVTLIAPLVLWLVFVVL